MESAATAIVTYTQEELNNEDWRVIPDDMVPFELAFVGDGSQEKRYTCSNLGRIRSKKYLKTHGIYTTDIITGCANRNGYLQVVLYGRSEDGL